MKTIIIYGTTTGNTEDVAKLIGQEIEDSEVVDVSSFEFDTITDYDLILLGSATFGFGELQDEWEEKADALDLYDISKKRVGIFGTGDQVSYPDSFAGSLSHLYNKVVESEAKIVGRTSTEGYDFEESESVVDGKFVGLVIDEDNQAQLTNKRVSDWVKQIKEEIA